MSDIAIKVENLSKRYVLNHQRAAGDGLRHVLQEKLTAPFRWLGGKIRGQKSEASPASASSSTSAFLPSPSALRPPISEEFWALKDVSFEVKRGEVVGIIGRNGAGKSTLLKILSRITEPTSGRITIEGRVASLLEVGTGFHPDLTGRENIFLNGAILGMSRVEIKRKFDEIVAFAEIEKFLDTPVKRYSSGMYVRLAFAVAAHLEPEILIVDEVLAVGDAEFQKKCLGKMSEVAQSGRTILFVSHNMGAIRNLCDRCLLLTKGSLTTIGRTAEVIHQYGASNRDSSQLTWNRPSERSDELHPMIFRAIRIELVGEQPSLDLELQCELVCHHKCVDMFVAVDICEASSAPIMQALPKSTPFIKGHPGEHQLRIQVELPPLIPGVYSLDLWLGSHYTQTVDYVKNAVAFEVAHSPSPDRAFPYSPDHGFMVPRSRCTYIPGGENRINQIMQ